MSKSEIHPFSLIVGEKEGEIKNADIPVRWCITPEFVSQMEKDGVVDPQILLVTTDYQGREMSRKLIPVGELMTYARFTKAGKCRIFAWLVNGVEGRKKLRSDFVIKTKGDYETTDLFDFRRCRDEARDFILDQNGNYIFDVEQRNDIPGAYAGTNELVEIPSGVFGKEPHPLVKWYVNFWHSGKLEDECHFRKRALIGIPKLIPFTIVTFSWWLIKYLWALVPTLAGYPQYTNWKYIRPWKYPISMIVDGFDLTQQKFWIYRYSLFKKEKPDNAKSDDGNRVFVTFTPFIPWIPIIVYTFAFVASGRHGDAAIITLQLIGCLLCLTVILDFIIGVAFWANRHAANYVIANWAKIIIKYITEEHRLILIFKVIIGIISLLYLWAFYIFPSMLFLLSSGIAIIVGIIFLVLKFDDMLYSFTTLDQSKNDPTHIREMLCPLDRENLKARYYSIPEEQRTIRLWYLDLKNNLCKPMQQ